MTRADIRSQLVYDTNSFLLGASAGTSMDRYNFQMNRVYRTIVNRRYWQWRLVTETVSSPGAGIYTLPTLYDNIHAVFDALPTTNPFDELTSLVTEDRQARNITFYDDDGQVDTSYNRGVRVRFYKMNLDMTADTDEPIFPYNYHPMIYHGAAALILSRMGRDAEAKGHKVDFDDYMKRLILNDVTAMADREGPALSTIPRDPGGNQLNFSEV